MPGIAQPLDAGRSGVTAGARSILIAGATGLVGQEILKLALAADDVEQVYAIGRRAPAIEHPKLKALTVEFSDVPAVPPAHELYLALGTTIKVAGSRDAFRAIDFDAGLAVAKRAFAAGVRQVGLVSAMGANPESRIFYNRVKGELEDALSSVGFDGLVLARPSLLIGNRRALGQPSRAGEEIGERLGKVLDVLIPAHYKPIAAARVAQALFDKVPAARGQLVLPSGAMR